MKLLVCLTLLCFNYSYGQSVVNAVLIDSFNRVTENPNTARYLIAVKKHSDSSFERVEYNFEGPRLRSIFYKDPDLKIKHGNSTSYSDSGSINISGSYINNKKSGTWYNSGKDVVEEYEDNVLVSTRPRVVKDTSKKETKHWEEVESAYPGGLKSYQRFLYKHFQYPNRALKLRKEGTAVIQFSVSKEGKPGDVSLARSVEFSIDEEVLRLASIMPDWIPARQDGKQVKSYKKQPVTFKLP